MAVPSTPPLPIEPPYGRIGRAVNLHRRHAWILGLAPWVGAVAVLALHGTGAALPDPTRFAMLCVWLLAAGCADCPALAVRRLPPEACRIAAAVLASAAVLLTALILGGQMHPRPATALFAVIVPLSGALQSANAAAAETRARRREAAARQDGRTEAAAEQVEVRYRALAGLDRLEGMTPAEIEALIEVAQGVLGVKLSDEPLRHLTSVPRTGGSRGGPRRATAVRRIDRA